MISLIFLLYITNTLRLNLKTSSVYSVSLVMRLILTITYSPNRLAIHNDSEVQRFLQITEKAISYINSQQ